MRDEEIATRIAALHFECPKEGNVARLLSGPSYQPWTDAIRKWFGLLIVREGKKFEAPPELKDEK